MTLLEWQLAVEEAAKAVDRDTFITQAVRLKTKGAFRAIANDEPFDAPHMAVETDDHGTRIVHTVTAALRSTLATHLQRVLKGNSAIVSVTPRAIAGKPTRGEVVINVTPRPTE